MFGVTLAILTLLEYDFMRGLGWRPLYVIDWPSGLALGPYGIWLTVMFILSGLLMAIFALGLRTALGNGAAPRIGTLSLLLAGCALAGLAFPTDPTFRSTPKTWHGVLHDLFFVLLGFALLTSMLALGRAFQTDSRWRRYGLYTFVTAAFALPSFALKGVAFYLFLGAILTWGFVIAIKLFSLSASFQ
jgi:uncharacterized membrane protein YidH (DUF202 family)